MGRVKRKDNNHQALADVFKRLGFSVIDLSAIGSGLPDMVVGNPACGAHMVEVKNPKTQYGRKGLSRLQAKFQTQWNGPVHIVRTEDEVIELCKRLAAGAEYRIVSSAQEAVEL